MAQKLFSEKNLYNFTTPFDFGADEHTRQTLLCPSPVLGALRRRWRGCKPLRGLHKFHAAAKRHQKFYRCEDGAIARDRQMIGEDGPVAPAQRPLKLLCRILEPRIHAETHFW